MPCASDALDEISKLAEGGGVQVLVTGSVLLVGDVRRRLLALLTLFFSGFCSSLSLTFAHFFAHVLLRFCSFVGARGAWDARPLGAEVSVEILRMNTPQDISTC